jgi:DNA-binding transcriptional MerR regulator
VIPTTQVLQPAEAARRLGVSVKALRLYEARGLITPGRSGSGGRAYGEAEMARAREIVALRGLGFSLAQIERALGGSAEGLDAALAEHQKQLERQVGSLSTASRKVADLRGRLAAGRAPSVADLAELSRQPATPAVAFDLPWPWGGERFELAELRPLIWIVGSMGSGKTRLALSLVDALPGAAFIGLDRLEADPAKSADVALTRRAEEAAAWLLEDGATASPALTALLMALEAGGEGAILVDMIEQDLDEATQVAAAAYLRRRGAAARPVIALTRSSAMLDLAEVGPNEALLLCPANHAPPSLVAPYPGAAGYEALATCLGPPDVRARADAVVPLRPEALKTRG